MEAELASIQKDHEDAMAKLAEQSSALTEEISSKESQLDSLKAELTRLRKQFAA